MQNLHKSLFYCGNYAFKDLTVGIEHSFSSGSAFLGGSITLRHSY